MGLRLLLDEDIQARPLVSRLLKAGHDVATVSGADLRTAVDEAVLARATALGRALLTRNGADFFALHSRSADHAGVIAVYQDGDPTRDMSWADIERALGKLEGTGLDLRGRFVELNRYR